MEIVTMVAALLACAFSLAALLRSRSSGGLQGEDLEKVRQDLLAELRQTRRELAEAQSRAAQTQDSHLREGLQHLAQQQNTLQRTVTDQLLLVNEQLKGTGLQSEQKLENIRQTVVINNLQNFRLIQTLNRLGGLVVIYQDYPFAPGPQQVEPGQSAYHFFVFVQNRIVGEPAFQDNLPDVVNKVVQMEGL